MADSDDDVPPLDDMSGLLQQVELLKEHKSSSNSPVVPNKENNSVAAKPDVIAKSKRDEPKTAKSEAPKSKTDSFGGFKKGFLFGGSKKESTGTAIKKTKSPTQESIPIIKPKASKEDSLKIPEVQAAMDAGQAMLQNKDQWLTEDLLQKVASNPALMKGMANPHFMQAITEFQTNPTQAAEKYKDNAAVQHFMKDFMGIMGGHFTNLADKQDQQVKAGGDVVSPSSANAADISVRSSTNPNQSTAEDDRKMQEILNNPEIRDILQDPKVQLLIETLRTDPDKAQRVLSMRDADLQRKIKRLCDVGLLQLQR